MVYISSICVLIVFLAIKGDKRHILHRIVQDPGRHSLARALEPAMRLFPFLPWYLQIYSFYNDRAITDLSSSTCKLSMRAPIIM